jgi:hypothetical protein
MITEFLPMLRDGRVDGNNYVIYEQWNGEVASVICM